MIFLDVVKQEVEIEAGSWCGSVEQNELADRKISDSVRKSLKTYEKNRKHYEQMVFEF